MNRFRLALAPVLAATLMFASFAAVAKAPPVAPARNTLADQAALGVAEAQWQMGLAVGKTPAAQRQALVWFGLAALNGHPQAAAKAAQVFESHNQLAEAARWWHRAGQLGNAAARTRWMDLFQQGKTNGEIPGRDAAQWLAERATSTHDSSLKLALGNAFAFGLGIAPDHSEAARWYQDAALDGNLNAMVQLGRLDLRQPAQWRAPDKEMDSDKHWKGPVLAPLRRLAHGEYAILDLGRQDVAGELNVPPERLVFSRPTLSDGVYWLNRARALGSPVAKTVLGKAQLDGLTLPFDPVDGSWLLAQAACEGQGRAALALARYWQIATPLRAWSMAEVAVRQGQKVEPEFWDGLSKVLNPRQITRARQMGQDWCVTE